MHIAEPCLGSRSGYIRISFSTFSFLHCSSISNIILFFLCVWGGLWACVFRCTYVCIYVTDSSFHRMSSSVTFLPWFWDRLPYQTRKIICLPSLDGLQALENSLSPQFWDYRYMWLCALFCMIAGEPPVILKLTYKYFFKHAVFLQLINKFKYIIKFSL